MTSFSDKELTRSIKDSDLEAFATLYKRYFESIYRFVCQRVQEEIAKDLTQDIFMRVWETRIKLDPGKPIKPYLYRIAANISIDYFRSQKKRQNDIPLSHADEILPSMENDNDLILTIRKSISELPEDLRTTFQLNRFEGFKYREIAEILGISIKTVESRMSKALKILNDKLSGIMLSMFL